MLRWRATPFSITHTACPSGMVCMLLSGTTTLRSPFAAVPSLRSTFTLATMSGSSPSTSPEVMEACTR